MLIEYFILIVLLAFMVFAGFVSLCGWMRADNRLEYERDINNDLQDEIKHLREENARLNSQISIVGLKIKETTK